MTVPTHLSETRFSDLPLHPTLRQALDDLGYTRCTPIQAATLPRALAGADIAGQAQTGTGKTVAFLLAVFDALLRDDAPTGGPRALVLAPTRELAIQIARDAEALGAHTGLKVGLAYGGADYDRQRDHIAGGVDLLIGTPGRIIDFQKQHVFPMKHLQAVVLDEADRMFDLGFIADIRYLLRRAPPPAARRNYLFSATLSQRVLELAFEHMNDPEKVTIEPERMTAHRLSQALIHVANDDKLPLLAGLVKSLKPARSIVFVNTKRAAELVEFRLRRRGLDARTISGDVPQAKRERLLERFKKGELHVLVATDVAARGLHIPEVSHVFNYDLPQDVEDYVHRIGRTARAGAEGTAISLACESYVYSLPEIEKYIGQKLGPFAGDVDELIRLGSERSAATDDGETNARDDGRQMRAERDGGRGGRGGGGGGGGRERGAGPRPDGQAGGRGTGAGAAERQPGGWTPRPGSRVWQRPAPAPAQESAQVPAPASAGPADAAGSPPRPDAPPAPGLTA